MKIAYLMSGKPHLPYLIASIHSLRESGWTGEIEVHAWPESFDIVRNHIFEDEQIEVSAVQRTPTYRGKNAQFIDKIKLLRDIDEPTLYLDADTTIHGSLSHIEEALTGFTFLGTQFNDWVSTGQLIQNRLKRLRDFPAINQESVEGLMSAPWPSLNGGVVAAQPDSTVPPRWLEWSIEAKSIFICDECVLHLMQREFPSPKMGVFAGGAFNCSPKFQPTNLSDSQVIIRHYHGDSNVRPDKCPRGIDLWLPIFKECLEYNLGGVREWWKSCGNSRLNKLMESRQESAMWC